MLADINICRPIQDYSDLSQIIENKDSKIHAVALGQEIGLMEEICHAPAVWLWDYLRRSGARGFMIPLSGGADSASVAAIVASMADLVLQSINQGNTHTLTTIRRIVRIPDF